MDLKIGGNDVGKLIYNGQEFGGSRKSGDIIYAAHAQFNNSIITEPHELEAFEGETYKVTYINNSSAVSTVDVGYSDLSSFGVTGSQLPIKFVKDENGFKLTGCPAGTFIIQLV